MSRFQEVARAIKEAQANPVEEFVSTYGEKNASRFDGAKDLLRRGGASAGKSLMDGLGAGLAMASIAAVSAGGEKAYSAMTRERDFKRMMASNPDLHTDHQNDPRTFNMAFNSLRSMNREFSSDPYVAGAYMRQAGPSNLQGGSLLAEKVYFPTKKNPNKLLDATLDAAAKSHQSRSQLEHQFQNQMAQQQHNQAFQSGERNALEAFQQAQQGRDHTFKGKVQDYDKDHTEYMAGHYGTPPAPPWGGVFASPPRRRP
jgi:hypothetical protein